MIRMRSTGSQKSNNDNSPVNSANSSPIATTPKRLSLNSIMPNNSNNSPHSQLADHDDDDDDDLRSLLSGGSLNLNEIKLASKPQRPGQQSQKQKQKQQQKQQQQKQQQQQNQPQLGSQESGHHSSHITHLSSLLDDNNNSLTMSSTSSSSSSNHHNSNSKKSLWVLGTIILAVGFLGPSGLLWDMFEDSDEISPFHHNNQYNHHGDKHHHLSPPPPPNAEGMMINNDNQHPMIRSAHGIERATSAREYTKYHQFGSDAVKPREKMKRGRKKGGNADGGIKDAIQNIDKVFLDKVPRGMGADDDDAGDFFFADDDNNEDGELLPVVHYNDGDTADGQRLDANADALDAYTYSQLPASDALECRASVIAFVINATDVRDECDGLRKAFDKTCSVVHQGAAQQQQQPPPQEGEGGGGSTAERQRRRRRRRLSEWGSPHLWNLIPEAYRREVQRAGGDVLHHVRHHVLRRGRNLFVREGGGTVRRAHNQTRRAMSVDHAVVERRAEEVAVGEEEQPLQEQPVQQQQQQQPIVSLNIPTADKHISEEMLADTLMLQESSDPKPVRASSVDTQATAQQEQPQQQQPPDNVVTQNPEFVPEEQIAAHDAIAAAQLDGETDSNPPVPVAHPPNITAEAAEAVQDAAESANAIRTAVETVKTSMNDPKSVEARTCCASILSVFHEHCDPTTTGVEDYSDRRLLVVVFVITVCGMVKSLIRHLGIRWLPEAGGCILVGVLGYVILQHMPHVQFAFDGDMFLRIMVPPIVFEAAVKINKSSFKRHVIPICIFAIVGTLASTAFTAFILYKGTKMFSFVTTIPLKESMIFGALISSIDPIAVLSVLNNMGISDTDTLYMLIFGESLLNDGVAIVVFETLLHFLDESLVIDSEVMGDAFMHFVVVALGSVAVGALSGACATVYFSLMHGCQTPMVEVIMFCCWSFIPYYICDMVEWSGIVAIVANGFVMDLYVIGQKHHQQHSNNSTSLDDEIEFLVNGTGRRSSQGRCGRIFNYEGHLSQKADAHVHFVIEIFATLMETAIFAYLGLFLFSPRYHWSIYLTLISILATVLGRVLMIPLLSYVANFFNRLTRGRRDSAATSALSNNGIEGVHIDRRMQLVLVFAGLRGAMSFALVEHIPMYDTTTGQGSRFKPELKAMTSASVIFTLFVLGGATSYLMEKLGYSIGKQQNDNMELTPLVPQEKRRSPHTKRNGVFNMANGTSRSTVRQRGAR